MNLDCENYMNNNSSSQKTIKHGFNICISLSFLKLSFSAIISEFFSFDILFFNICCKIKLQSMVATKFINIHSCN